MERNIEPSRIKRDASNNLRDLLFYINFPLVAMISVFFRSAFFNDSNKINPSLSNLGNSITLNINDFINYFLMVFFIFLPIIVIGISHMIIIETIEKNFPIWNHFDKLMNSITIDVVILFLGFVVCSVSLGLIFNQPYIFVIFAGINTLFFFGKAYLLFSQERRL